MFGSFTYHAKRIMPVIGIMGVAITLASPVNAQMENNPWNFQPQNRASVAALIRQVEKEKSSASALTQIAAPASYTNLTCGGDSKPTASGNNTCIILNNSEGNIHVGQDSEGNQTATNNQTSQSGADDILTTLTESPAN